MSSANDTRLSSLLFKIGLVSLSMKTRLLSLSVGITGFLLFLCAGCMPFQRPNEPSLVSDRLVNLLIQNQLPLGEPVSALRGEVERCGQWLREKLQANPAETFRLTPDDTRLTAVSSGAQRILVPDLHIRLVRLNSFFHTNSAVPKNVFDPQNIRRSVVNPVTQKAILELVQQDQTEMYSETGGIVMADLDTPVLRFLVIEPDNARWVRQLEKTDSHESFAEELRRILPSLPYLKVRAERTLDALRETESDENQQRRQAAIDSFMELLSYSSRYSYILEQKTQYAALAESDISGVYMGVFHVHPPDNPPSPEDKLGSILRKNFVLVPKDHEIEVHYLDFTADLSRQPNVIRLAIDSDALQSASVE